MVAAAHRVDRAQIVKAVQSRRQELRSFKAHAAAALDRDYLQLWSQARQCFGEGGFALFFPQKAFVAARGQNLPRPATKHLRDQVSRSASGACIVQPDIGMPVGAADIGDKGNHRNTGLDQRFDRVSDFARVPGLEADTMAAALHDPLQRRNDLVFFHDVLHKETWAAHRGANLRKDGFGGCLYLAAEA